LTAKEYTTCVALWADDVMRFAMRCCNVRADCEDAVQEALAGLWQRREEIKAEKGKSYLMGAAYRQLMMRFRQQDLQRRHALAFQTDNLTMPDERFDLREAIEKSLQMLPPVQRAILQLRDVEGYSYHEIALTLNLSDDRVQVYLFRARVNMRKQLKLMGYDNNR